MNAFRLISVLSALTLLACSSDPVVYDAPPNGGAVSGGGGTTATESTAGSTVDNGSTGETTSGGTTSGGTTGGSATSGATTSGATTSGGTTSGGTTSGGTTGSGTVGSTCPLIAEASPPVTSGVAYSGAFYEKKIRIYRTDGPSPREETSIETNGFTHDMVIDPYHDRLFVVSDVAQTVSIYQLYRPANASAALTLPTLAGTITLPYKPLFARVDPHRNRLWIVSFDPAAPLPLVNSFLHGFDITNPAAPTQLTGSPFSIPITASLDIDPLAGILFVTGITDHHLHLYDLTSDVPTLRPGQPINLKLLYPETNSTSFGARDVQVDPWRGRVYAARAQTALSELIAFVYAPSVPQFGNCPTRPDHNNLAQMADAFPVNQPVDAFTHLLDAFKPIPDLHTGAVFLMGNAWSGIMSTGLITPMTASLQHAAACQDFNGPTGTIGCWMQPYNAGLLSTNAYEITEGAACLDTTRKILVSTTISTQEDGPGKVLFHQYTDDLVMTPIPPNGGQSPSGGLHPIAIVCH